MERRRKTSVSATDIQAALEQTRKGALDAAKRVELQRNKWHTEERKYEEWCDQQRRKITVIDEMLKGGDALVLHRVLSMSEQDALSRMKAEIALEIEQRAEDLENAKGAEDKIMLTAEQRCVLYAADAVRKEKQRKRTMRLSRLSRASIRETPRSEKSDKELRRTAIEKSQVIQQHQAELEYDAAQQAVWVAEQNAVINAKRKEMKEAEMMKDKERAESLNNMLKELTGRLQAVEWEYSEKKQWQESQLPVLSEDERRVLRGIDSTRKMRSTHSEAGPRSRRGKVDTVLENIDIKKVLSPKKSSAKLLDVE